MTDHINTRDLDATAGAVYFAVGRGTEGGVASYHLAIAGITVGLSEPHWGSVERVAQNSGYSLGAIQVDFGQRGSWPLGAISGRALQPGERTYVDAVIAQASAYADAHALPFAQDHDRLRTQLLSHGNGQGRRSAIQFIDTDTRDSINAWAGSDAGKQWIHTHIDYPQVRNATRIAMTMVDTHGSGIAEADRFAAISIIAKTANQIPTQLPKLEKVLQEGGSYRDLRDLAGNIRQTQRYYDGPKAGDIAQRYEAAYANNHEAMDRAHAKVARADYAPGVEAADADIRTALAGLQPVRGLRVGAAGAEVLKLENNLSVLGFAAQAGWAPDRHFDAHTQSAVTAFQQANGLAPADGQAREATLAAIQQQARDLQQRLADAGMTDRQGRTLGVDGYLGAGSRHALSQYQQLHGLAVSGIADEQTRQALDAQMAMPPHEQRKAEAEAAVQPAVASAMPAKAPHEASRVLLTDTAHPHHALYRQALAGVHQAEAAHGMVPGEHSIRLAAALTVAAVEQGLSRIDRVELSDDGVLARATQISALRDDSAFNLSTTALATSEAIQHSLDEHSARSLSAAAGPVQRPHDLANEQDRAAPPVRNPVH